MHLESHKCFAYYTREKKEYQHILKKTKNFEKSACFFLKSLLSYLSACERASITELRWEVQRMAKCDFCGKGVTFGIKVSHSHRRSNRTWKPNVKRVKAVVNGTPCHVYACTRCLRSNKVERAI
jgi:large subunit ribosomal protein L28